MKIIHSLSFIALLCAGTFSTFAADDAGTPEEQLARSLKKWQELKKQCGGNYSYQVRHSSFTGAGSATTIIVRANKVTERRYEMFDGRPASPEVGPSHRPVAPKWIEKGAEIGKHKEGDAPKSLDDIYAEAKTVLAAKLEPHQKRYIRFDAQGLIYYCFYVDTRIADDVPKTGVSIDNLKLEPAKKNP